LRESRDIKGLHGVEGGIVVCQFLARFSRRRPSCARGFRAREEPTTKQQITTNSDYRKENARAAAITDDPPAFAGLAVEARPLRA
jgi:hypothetical protein